MDPDSPPAPSPIEGSLLILSGLPLRAFPLPPGKVILGRAPEADFRLDHCEVSRRHCEVDQAGGAFWLTDLGSKWGTKVGPISVKERTALHPGDVLTLGGVQLLYSAGPIPTPAELQQRAGAAATTSSAPASILFRGAPAISIPLDEDDSTTLGRDPGSSIVLNSPVVSRHHAVITRGDEGYRIADLKSSAGSLANGHRFDEHPLVIGDRLQLGPFHFVFDGSAIHSIGAASGGSIRARDICRSINGRTLLKDISLDVAPGRFVGVIGPSGAGKSSLLSVLVGAAAPDSGEVVVDGVPVSAGGGASHWGFVPQAENVHAELTVSDALDFAARLRFPKSTPRSSCAN